MNRCRHSWRGLDTITAITKGSGDPPFLYNIHDTHTHTLQIKDIRLCPDIRTPEVKQSSLLHSFGYTRLLSVVKVAIGLQTPIQFSTMELEHKVAVNP